MQRTSTMGERRTCWKAQPPMAFHASRLVSERCFPETQRRLVKNLRPQTTQKTRPGCTQKTHLARYFEAYPALQDHLELTNLLTDMVVTNTSVTMCVICTCFFRDVCTSGVIPEMKRCSCCSNRVSRHFTTRNRGNGVCVCVCCYQNYVCI